MEILKIKTEKRELGNFGEEAAVKFLKKAGYQIKMRNYVSFENEVDIVAEDGYAVAFVEVKTRDVENLSPNEPRPASAVNPKKQRGIVAAAAAYMAYYRPQKHARLDVIEVYVKKGTKGYAVVEIKHLKDAFNRNTAYGRKRR